MKPLTHFRLCLAQLIMMLSTLFLFALVIRDHNWPNYLYWVNAFVVAFLSVLIPSDPEAYRPPNLNPENPEE